MGPTGLLHQSVATPPLICDGDILALTQLLSVKQTWMLRTVIDIQWSEVTLLHLFYAVSPKNCPPKQKSSLLWVGEKKNQGLAKVALLGWIIGMRSPCKSLDFMFTFCLFASSMLERTYCTTFPVVGQKMLWIMGHRHYGSSWPRARSIAMCMSIMMRFSFLPLWETLTSWILQNFQKVFY